MRIFEGNIVTVNRNNDCFKYLVEEHGRIQYVGDILPKKYEGYKTIKLGKRALLPSFVDTHQHFASFSTFHASLNVMDATSNEEMSQMIKEFVRNSKGKTLIAFGASPYSVQEGKLISREELDEVCPDKEIMVVKYDGHACIVNSKLLKKIDKKVYKLRGYHPDTGEMNQEAFFQVSNYITNAISIPELFKNMQNAVDYMASKGIGCVHTVSGVGFIGNLDITMEQLFAKGLSNGFQLRVFPQSMNIKVATRRKIPRIGGCFECALDGCFGSHDAAMIEPYADDEKDFGVLYYDDDKVKQFCIDANRENLQIEIHAIGDRAFDQACRAIKEALDDYPREDHRHGIIHDCLPTKEGLEICEKYKIQLPMQSAFIDWKQEPDEYLESILGKERLTKLNPIKSIADKNIMVSFGSDAPCTSPDPIIWIHKAVNHSNPQEAITVEDAVRMCTYNGYWTTFDEEERGSLEVGKIADMVILSDNPYTVDKDKIKDIRAEQLFLHGRKYKECSASMPKHILKGIITRDLK